MSLIVERFSIAIGDGGEFIRILSVRSEMRMMPMESPRFVSVAECEEEEK
jgi:hypothetical protein